jgi:multidrug resistance efflux pump
MKEAKLDLRHCDITAETDGVVVRVEVVPGSCVDAGQQLAIIRSNGNR